MDVNLYHYLFDTIRHDAKRKPISNTVINLFD